MSEARTHQDSRNGLEVAVIGMAGVFPEAKNIYEFWQNLRNGVESIVFLSAEELKETGIDPQWPDHAHYVPSPGGVLEGKAYFDAAFFGFAPLEAETMDPQLRLLHECAWTALEDAGCNPEDFNGSIGLYAGASANFGWEALTVLAGKKGRLGEFAASQLVDRCYLSTRISYKLNLRGPALTVQTACSTSLLTIHLACRGLQSGDCDIALAGGVSLFTSSDRGYLYQEGLILSPDGHCRAFDARAGGTAAGEGAGIVALKSLEEAIDGGDHIYAVIKGSAANNDGFRKVGFSGPSIEGQAEVIAAAFHMAEVEPDSIGYVETHGTGTSLGDPVEAEALKLAFNTSRRGICALGSVKTNIGHLDAAAGIAGFIKAVLALHHREIPASLHFQVPNPEIDFENSPFYVNTRLKTWEGDGYPLRAGVSSFGIGGTNVHVILEAAPAVINRNEEAVHRFRPQLIPLSARTKPALERMTANLADFFMKNPDIDPADAAYTLQTGRQAFAHRRMLVCQDIEEAAAVISSAAEDRLRSFTAQAEDRPVIFMFSGQGSQYVNMGLGLYESEPLFRQELDRCFDILKSLTGRDFKEILYPPEITASSGSAPAELNRTEMAQPLLFAVEYATARLLLHWGIEANAMIGHSLGEYVAAHLVGIFSLEEALQLVSLRGQLMQAMPGGAMLSVSLGEKELRPLLDETLSLAAVNSSTLCTVSGETRAIAAFEKRLANVDCKTRRLVTSHAFHSPMMEPILADFERAVKQIGPKRPELAYISNLTGKRIGAEEVMDAGYWARHLRHTVRFADGLGELLKEDGAVFLEVGPGRALSTFVRQHKDKRPGNMVLDLLRHPQEDISDNRYWLTQVGQLWLFGKKIDWMALHAGDRRRRLPMPTYPFEEKRYWIEGNLSLMGKKVLTGTSAPVKKAAVSEWFYIPSWKRAHLLQRRVSELAAGSGWLVFSNGSSLSLKLVEELQKLKQAVVVVNKGREFLKLNEAEFVIEPGNRDHYDALIGAVGAAGLSLRHVVSLWNISQESDDRGLLQRLDRTLAPGFYSLLYLAQALGRQETVKELRITAITHSLYRVTGDEVLNPEQALCLGPVEVIPLEYPAWNCRSIDVVAPPSGSLKESELVGQLMEELAAEPVEAVIALRSRLRWIRHFEKVKLPGTSDRIRGLKQGGVYWITGGLGGIGLVLARYLAEKAGARLILSGRSPFPPREQWLQWLDTHCEGDPTSQKIQQLREIEKSGAEIRVFQADVSDTEQMRSVVARVKADFGRVNGIIHCAGIADYAGVIQRRERETSDRVLAPKVQGTAVLAEVVKDEAPDFIVLCSSINSFLPTIGQAGYTSANSFLDAFSHFKAPGNGGTPVVLSINWDGWQEVGMAAAAAQNMAEPRQDLLKFSIHPSEGVEAFARILDAPLAQVIVSTVDLAERREQYDRLKTKRTEPGVPGDEQEKSLAVPITDVEQTLAAIWQELLGIKEVGIFDDFFELGGDSLKAVTVCGRIQKACQVTVPLAEFFNRPTIGRLGQFIRQELGKGLFDSITPVEKREFYVLSPSQKRMYILWQMEGGNTGYNMPTAVELEGPLDRHKLEQAFGRLIGRHDSLRTFFFVVDGEPVQRTGERVGFQAEFYDCPNSERTDAEAIIQDFIRPFDLAQPPLLRVGLIRPSESGHRHILLVDMHHIVSDGTSQLILMQEFMQLYRGEELPPLAIQYKDFAQWQQRLFDTGPLKKRQDFWLRLFDDDIPVLHLPADYPRPAVQSFAGSGLHFGLGPDTSRRLKQLAAAEGVTFYMLLLAVFNLFLSKLCGQEDIVVGTPIAGRHHPDVETVIGMFVNTLSMRNYPRGDTTFKEFLGDVKHRTLQVFENQDYPFEDLVDRVVKERDMSRNPLFDAALVFQNMFEGAGDIPEQESVDLKLRPFGFENQTAKFDLTLTAGDMDDRLGFTLEYCTSLFKRKSADRFVHYFKNSIAAVLDNPDNRLAELEILGEEEKQWILHDLNDTAAAYPEGVFVHQLFESQVEKNPDRIAVAAGNGESCLTYRRLNGAADQLAVILKNRGAGENRIIGLLIASSPAMIFAVLAVLKTGSAYLPIDPDYPAERIRYLLHDSRAHTVLTDQQNRLPESVDGYSHLVIEESPEPAGMIREEKCITDGGSGPSNLAYVIYTSGTTGKPRGVLIEHRNVVRLLFNDRFQFDFDERDVWTLFHSYCFDFSVWEMYGALLYGGKLVVISRELARDTAEFLQLLKAQAVSVLNQTPSAFTNLMAVESAAKERDLYLRYVIFGGEALSPERLKSWKERYPETRLINMYGITETTVHVTFKELEAKDMETAASHIGTPIPTLTVYALDAYGKPVPRGTAGELFIGGAGLGRGYLNQPELTSEKFIDNPYRQGDRLYRSGDLVQLLPEGEMAYLGRIDQQVKIRGFRVELAEIESRLLDHPGIGEAVVIAHTDDRGDKTLCAYIAPLPTNRTSRTNETSPPELREYLSRTLPDYMIPSFYIQVERIPLTPNGKVDRRALPAPQIYVGDSSYSPPTNEVEERLASIWSEVLGIDRENIGIDGNFFSLGGHSLRAAMMLPKIQSAFGVTLPLAEIFRTPTIRQIAHFISQHRPSAVLEVEYTEEKEVYELSFHQRRVLILSQMDPRSPAYHMPLSIELNHPLQPDHVRAAIAELVDRHESLRTGFKTVDHQPVQYIAPGGELPYRFIDLSSLTGRARRERRDDIYVREATAPFDLSAAPLFRAALVRLQEDRHELFFNIHHIVSDGWSLEVLRREFRQLYEGRRGGKEVTLPVIACRYRDFAAWQHRRFNTAAAAIEEAHAFWVRKLKGGIPLLQLPVDFPGKTDERQGAGHQCTIDVDLGSRLRELAAREQTTLFTVMFSAFLLLLSRYAAHQEVMCGIIDAGREQPIFHGVVGFFVNAVLFRSRLDGEERSADLIRRIHREIQEVFEHKSYPLEPVFQELNLRYPELPVSFNMVNIQEEAAGSGLETFAAGPVSDVQDVKFDIEPYIREHKNGITVYWTYRQGRFAAETIEYMAAEYLRLLKFFADNAAGSLKDYRRTGKRRHFERADDRPKV
jgi:amino acid adenylation domain-containing protein